MSLSDGDYIIIRDSVVSAIEADTGIGGLFETGDPPVKTVEAEIRREPLVYRDHEAPAIAVVIKNKNERRESGAYVRIYRLALYIFLRGIDAEAEIARCMRIASRLEDLLREENAPSRQLCALPAQLPWSVGSLDLTPGSTQFITGEDAQGGQKKYSIVGIVEADISIPAVVY